MDPLYDYVSEIANRMYPTWVFDDSCGEYFQTDSFRGWDFVHQLEDGRLKCPFTKEQYLENTPIIRSLRAMGIDTCLAIYPQATWDKFTEKFASLPMTQSRVMRPLFANAVKCELDSQGRIVIPQKLRKYAQLEKDAVILGVNARAEIWTPKLWQEDEEEMTPAKMAECMSALGF